MRYLSLCSGIEAATVAWEPLGWEPAAFSEIEPFPRAVLKYRFPEVPNFGDMSAIRSNGNGGIRNEIRNVEGPIDLLVGGTPCQGFSYAGKRGGLRDPRSGLAMQYVRLLREIRPEWCLWENVPGCLTTDDGRDFIAFVKAIVESGFGVCWRVLDAQFTRTRGFPRAVPQRRRRLFLVGRASGDWRSAAKVLFESPDEAGHTPPVRRLEERNVEGVQGGPRIVGCDVYNGAITGDVAATVTAASGGHNSSGPKICIPINTMIATAKPNYGSTGSTGIGNDGDPCFTLLASHHHIFAYGEDKTSRMEIRNSTPIECERLMGFPDDWTKVPFDGKTIEECPDSPRYKALGNSMCVNVMQWIGERLEAARA